MNNNMTTFDEQWELLEGQHVARNMVRQLPAWQRRRRLRRRMALTVVGVVAVATAAALLLRPDKPLPGDYTLVCSNRSQQFTDQQWADLAAVLLDDNNNSILI
jgi:hypothetical protein